MRYATVDSDSFGGLVLVLADAVLPMHVLEDHAETSLPNDMLGLIQEGDQRVRAAFHVWERAAKRNGLLSLPAVRFLAPYRHPGKIWGIGLNYRDHASDLGEAVPSEPASFMRPSTTIIGPGDNIVLPPQSRKVTAEAELGLVIGRRVCGLDTTAAMPAIFGYTPIIDVTAEDILRENPRFLTRAKSFDTFFSFGPWIVTPDEIPDLGALTVETIVNATDRRANQVKNMTYSPLALLAFHSHNMTWEPGDILSTGTPGAIVVNDGDEVACRIDGIGVLRNRVRRMPERP